MEKKKTPTKSPFKDQAILEKEITTFLNKYKTIVANQAKRMSDFLFAYDFNEPR